MNLLEKPEQTEKQLHRIRLLLDRQFVDPFIRYDDEEVKRIKGEVRIHS